LSLLNKKHHRHHFTAHHTIHLNTDGLKLPATLLPNNPPISDPAIITSAANFTQQELQ
jgi:hypothetical protein